MLIINDDVPVVLVVLMIHHRLLYFVELKQQVDGGLCILEFSYYRAVNRTTIQVRFSVHVATRW